MLEQVKANLLITGSYQDTVIQGWIKEIQRLMIDGGIDKNIAEDVDSAGVIARGIDDIYFSKGELSKYFWQRAIQLSYKKPPTPDNPDLFYTKEEINKIVEDMFIETNRFHFVSTENQDIFEFTGTYDVLEVVINGLVALTDMFQIEGNSIKLNHPLKANQKVEIILHKLNKEGA